MDGPRLRVADVVRTHGAAFVAAHGARLTHEQLTALRDIERCRTAALGGHVEVYACGHERIAYNSCRNRNCTRCLGHKARDWVEQKERDLLPVPYFHVVFTLPHELTDVPVAARAALYEALFRASSATLREVVQRRLGGEAGFLSVLHTWGQTLTHHPHVHCVVAGGALASKCSRWTAARSRYLLPVKALAAVFKGKMLAELRRKGLHGVEPAELELLLRDAAMKTWVVYAKAPFGGPTQVLRYLARYTHKIAISDARILRVDSGTVTFSYRDYRDASATKAMRLGGGEWLRRFLSHVLPRGFVRLRSYGFLANTKKASKLEVIRTLLGARKPAETSAPRPPTLCACPICGQGLLVERRALPRFHDTS